MTKLTLLGRVEDCERDRRRRGALTQDVATSRASYGAAKPSTNIGSKWHLGVQRRRAHRAAP